MTTPELPVDGTTPSNQQGSVSAAGASEPTNQCSVSSVKPARKRGVMNRKSNDPSPKQLPMKATEPTTRSLVTETVTETTDHSSASVVKPGRKRAIMDRKAKNHSALKNRNNEHKESTTGSDELRTLKSRARRQKKRSNDDEGDDDIDETEDTTTCTRPGALFIASPGNNESFEDDAEETMPPADHDVEDPKLHEVEAKLVEEGVIVHGEVVRQSRAKVALLLSALIGVVLVIVLATVLTRNKGDNVPVLLVASSAPTLQPSMQPTQSVSGRLYDLLFPISGEKLMNTSSPQYKAFSWLVSEDPSSVAHNEETQDWVLTERYVIALLYFEWFTPDVAKNYKFMSNLSVCEWKFEDLGIYCFEEGRDIGRVAQVNIFGTNHPIQGTLPSELAALVSMEYLALPSHENLTGSIPSEFGTLGQLVSLVMTDCSLTGTIPEEIRNLSKLNWFDVRNNRLEGTLPELSKKLIVFEVFVVSDNLLTGTIPEFHQTNLFRLRSIGLNNNFFTGTIPTSFWTLQSLEQLFLNSNSLEGTLPRHLSSAGVLNTLHVSYNELTGSLPQILPESLMVLGLSTNRFDGSIPTEIGNLAQLTQLFLDNNNLSGPIPSEIGRLVNLVDLYLSDNRLTGTIPSEFGLLVNAGSFLLRNNSLTGQVPSTLSNLGILNPNGPCHVELQDTDIIGTLDPAFCTNSNSTSTATATSSLHQEVFASCLDDSAPVECSCCYACCNATWCACNSNDCLADI